MSGFTRAASVLGAVALVSAVATPAVGAGTVNIDHVESSGSTVKALLALDQLGSEPDIGSITVTYDGKPVDSTAELVSSGDLRRTTMLVIDTSLSMKGEPIEAAKAAAASFIDAAPDDVEIGLVSFSDEVSSVSPTLQHDDLKAQIDGFSLRSGTKLYDAIDRASTMLDNVDGAHSILVLSDGVDKDSEITLEALQPRLAEAEVVVDVVSLDQAPEFQLILEELSGTSGGTVISADASALADVFARQADALSQAAVVTFDKPEGAANEGNIVISIAADGTQVADTAFIAFEKDTSVLPDSFVAEGTATPAGLFYIGGAALAVGLAVILIFVMVGTRKSILERQMAYYTTPAGAAMPGAPQIAVATPSQIVDSAIAFTNKALRADFETRLALRIAGAGMQWTAAEWLLLHAGIAVTSACVGFLWKGVPLAVFMLIVGIVGPWLYLKIKHSRRIKAFNSQLAETLQLIAGGMSAGLSLPQAVDTIVREGAEPMANEMRRALVEQRLGVDIPDALDGIAERMESLDFSWVVMAIRVQREVGGNLSELLTTVSSTLREREYVRRQVQVLSAEGRISAWVLSLLPVVMLAYLLIVRPEFVRPMFTTTIGWILLGLATVLEIVGIFVLNKLIKIEV